MTHDQFTAAIRQHAERYGSLTAVLIFMDAIHPYFAPQQQSDAKPVTKQPRRKKSSCGVCNGTRQVCSKEARMEPCYACYKGDEK